MLASSPEYFERRRTRLTASTSSCAKPSATGSTSAIRLWVRKGREKKRKARAANRGRRALQQRENTRRGHLKVAATLGEWLHFALEADVGSCSLLTITRSFFEMLAAAAFELGAGNPLAANERSFGDVFDGLAVPGDGATMEL